MILDDTDMFVDKLMTAWPVLALHPLLSFDEGISMRNGMDDLILLQTAPPSRKSSHRIFREGNLDRCCAFC